MKNITMQSSGANVDANADKSDCVSMLTLSMLFPPVIYSMKAAYSKRKSNLFHLV